MATDKSNLRRAARLALTPKGEIIDGATTLKAIIQDLSDNGASLLCSKDFESGKILGLKLHLPQDRVVECEVEVRHSGDMGTGLKIVSMDEKNRRVYDSYLQEFYSQQLGKLG